MQKYTFINSQTWLHVSSLTMALVVSVTAFNYQYLSSCATLDILLKHMMLLCNKGLSDSVYLRL